MLHVVDVDFSNVLTSFVSIFLSSVFDSELSGDVQFWKELFTQLTIISNGVSMYFSF